MDAVTVREEQASHLDYRGQTRRSGQEPAVVRNWLAGKFQHAPSSVGDRLAMLSPADRLSRSDFIVGRLGTIQTRRRALPPLCSMSGTRRDPKQGRERCRGRHDRARSPRSSIRTRAVRAAHGVPESGSSRGRHSPSQPDGRRQTAAPELKSTN